MQVYTAIVGDRDNPREDVFCFKGEGIFSNPVMEAKRYKVLPHKFFNEDTTWVDGNVWMKEPIDLEDYDVACFKHPFRKSIWEEFETLKDDKRFNILWLQERLRAQEEHYKKKNLPEMGLFECNFLVRKYSPKVNKAMNDWWAEICRWQWRDQVSFPYIVWKHDLKVKVIDGNIREHSNFIHYEH